MEMSIKLQPEGGGLARHECETASGESHNLSGDAQSDAASVFFGSEERDKNLFGHFRRYGRTIVADLDDDRLRFVAVASDGDASFFA